ncbi:hypothetical protein MHA_2317 [Mannheimia haemolytica PHL213]|nr:hypothetical protein MHA_2317 [Mannheimia haemolytica PHL213]
MLHKLSKKALIYIIKLILCRFLNFLQKNPKK